MKRRTLLRALCYGGAAAAAAQLPVFRAFAGPEVAQDEFFILIHAAGAWDVTLSLDPRNEKRGIIDPATSGPRGTIDPAPIRLWKDAAGEVDGGITYAGPSFTMVVPPGPGSLRFGPAIGDLLRHAPRLTVFNGVAMNTVSHQDGTAYSATGRHLAGTKAVASSIDTMLADALGTKQLIPAISVNYPSFFVSASGGGALDRRAVPLAVSSIGTVAASLRRTNSYDTAAQRDAVNALLSQEARALAAMSAEAEVLSGFEVQMEGLRRMNQQSLVDAFIDANLRARYPNFKYAEIGAAVNAAFSLEAMSRNLVRCVSFSHGSFDTHFTNYRSQPLIQQRLFDLLATLLDYLDALPHPTRMGSKLADHTHILVVSDFCRTPQINTNLGRDHYPNNSALVISPRFKGRAVIGAADDEQLLPRPVFAASDGMRAITPPDILATFLSAFGVDPRRYLRDGEVIKAALKA